MSKKQRNIHLQKQGSQNTVVTHYPVPVALQLLAMKRIGGAVNFTGIHFQLLYAIYLVLSTFSEKANSISIQMEGVEDIDLYLQRGTLLIQVKTSQQPIDAGKLWNLKVLQHFMDAYVVHPTLTFRLAHNSSIAKGKLNGLGTTDIDDDSLQFWYEKFREEGYTASQNGVKDFLSRVQFAAMTTEELTEKIHQILLRDYNINTGTEQAFHLALFNWVFDCSKNRTTVVPDDLSRLMQSVKDSFSRFPANPAIQHQWIKPVDFSIPEGVDTSSYYEGKAARPVDIALGLPVERPQWISKIRQSIARFDVTVLVSSSGQGKSTLAWQAGYALQKESCSIYQVHSCAAYHEASALTDFIVSRIRVGQQPVVIFDGMHRLMAAWHDMAKLLRDQPVKMVVTSREEDWVRYAQEAASVSINTISISLAMDEARSVFNALKVAGAIHESISDWQPVWEKIKDRGLMIEFIYLLTRGQMIAERLSQQIRQISHEPACVAKLELLRMIAVADVLNIKLRTRSLTEHIQSYTSISVDRNELFRQLEKEYFIRFDKTYVEGLHPVRSQHLVAILHSHIPVEETLLHVLKMLDDQFVYDFFINAPILFALDKHNAFYGEAAGIMAHKSFPEMVYAIDGLMHLEPYTFWKENQQIFDSVYKRGGLQVFAMDTIPFNNLQTLTNIASSVPGKEGDNIRWMMSQLQLLTPYNFKDSVLHTFVQSLQQELQQSGTFTSLEGISFLFKWFRQLNITFPDIVRIDEDHLLRYLADHPIEESSDLFHFYSILQPDAYKQFVEKHKSLIIGWLKRKTQTLSIFDEGTDMHIHYMLDKDVDKAHELSIMRARFVFCFFPHYEHYCTKLILLPYPNEDFYHAVVLNATKQLTPGILGNDFDVHINRIWLKTITSQYASGSVYEWQKAHIQLREEALELYKKCTRLPEAHLEKNVRKVHSLAHDIELLSSSFFAHLSALPDYPSENKKYFESPLFSKEQGAIASWAASFRNFLNQLGGLVSKNTQRSISLPIINLESAIFQLPGMQQGFDSIVKGSVAYFSTDDLCAQENTWLRRLLDTASFYGSQALQSFPDIIPAANRAVEAWSLADREQRLQHVHAVLKSLEKKSRFTFHYPTHIVQEEHLRYAVIGITHCDPTNEEDLWELSVGLMELGNADIHFYTLVLVDADNHATGAFRVKSDYFYQLFSAYQGIETKDNNLDQPIPQIPDEKMLETIPTVSLPKDEKITQTQQFTAMMFALWKLCEYRSRLDPSLPPEQLWLEEMENELIPEIRENPPLITDDALPPKIDVEEIIQGKRNLTADEVCAILFQNLSGGKL